MFVENREYHVRTAKDLHCLFAKHHPSFCLPFVPEYNPSVVSEVFIIIFFITDSLKWIFGSF